MSCSSTATARQQAAPRFRHRPRTTVVATDDYTADNDVDSVISQAAAITVTFPPNPLVGQPITLLAASGANITADAGDNNLDVSQRAALVTGGSGATWFFIGNELGTDGVNDPAEPGNWIPLT